jgi:hypothetical protein
MVTYFHNMRGPKCRDGNVKFYQLYRFKGALTGKSVSNKHTGRSLRPLVPVCPATTLEKISDRTFKSYNF